MELHVELYVSMSNTNSLFFRLSSFGYSIL